MESAHEPLAVDRFAMETDAHPVESGTNSMGSGANSMELKG
jgi:hypothetical protein